MKCRKCRQVIDPTDMVDTWCRWCTFKLEVEFAILTQDSERAELAAVKYRTLAPVLIAQMGEWDEYQMLREAYG